MSERTPKKLPSSEDRSHGKSKSKRRDGEGRRERREGARSDAGTQDAAESPNSSRSSGSRSSVKKAMLKYFIHEVREMKRQLDPNTQRARRSGGDGARSDGDSPRFAASVDSLSGAARFAPEDYGPSTSTPRRTRDFSHANVAREDVPQETAFNMTFPPAQKTRAKSKRRRMDEFTPMLPPLVSDEEPTLHLDNLQPPPTRRIQPSNRAKASSKKRPEAAMNKTDLQSCLKT